MVYSSQDLWAIHTDAKWIPDSDQESFYCESRVGIYGLNGSDAGILAQAKSIIDWNQRYIYCPQCGCKTDSIDSGYKRLCSNVDCKAHQSVQNYAYPRTDAVVIVNIISADGERCLLGRKREWQKNMFSCIGSHFLLLYFVTHQ